MTDKHRAVNAVRMNRKKNGTPPNVIEEYINAAKPYIATLIRILLSESPHKRDEYKHALKELEGELSALLRIVRDAVYPGKTEAGHNAG
jgi:hypothetical protein